MEFKERVKQYLSEATKAGYKRFATRLSNDLGKEVSPEQVKKYIKKLDRRKVMKEIKKRSEEASNKDAYKYGTIYKIMLNHFKGS